MTCSTFEDLAEKVCDLERRFFGAETDRALVRVERIVDELATREAGRLPLSRQVALLNRALFREQNLRFASAETSLR